MPALLEVCVDTIEGAEAAVRGGAGRIELCAALSEGGLTPSAGLMRRAAALPVSVYAMIRPRGGDFRFSPADEAVMAADIEAARAAGLAGVVLGAQGADGGLDAAMLARLSDAAGPLGRTLHRVIDVVPDPIAALDRAVGLGFERVLTSGGAATAAGGAERIARMVRHGGGRIVVMPGAGLTPGNVTQVLDATGANEVHASCSHPLPGDLSVPGFAPAGGRRETSEAIVRAMVAALDG